MKRFREGSLVTRREPSSRSSIKVARLLFFCTLMVVSAISYAPNTTYATILPSCAIHLSDLRQGYTVAAAGYSITDMDALQYHVSLAPFNADAALVSYTTSFYLPQTPNYRAVESSVSLYQNTRKAHAAYQQNLPLISRWHRIWSYSDRAGLHQMQERWRAVSMPAVGDEGGGWLTETHDAHHAYSITLFFFRRGLYLASVRIFGPLNTVIPSQATPLVHLLDRRIQSVCAVG